MLACRDARSPSVVECFVSKERTGCPRSQDPMTKQHFGSAHVPLSPAVRAGDSIYISGQVPTLPDGSVVQGGIEEQTRAVMDNLARALALAGAGLEDVVKTTVILADA